MINLNKLLKFIPILFFFLILSYPLEQFAQTHEQNKFLPEPLQGDKQLNKVIPDPRVRAFVYPERIVWQSENSDQSEITNSNYLITQHTQQVTLENKHFCTMINNGKSPGILLDFGTELYGGIQIMLGQMEEKTPAKFRVRFGESVGEAMSDTGGVHDATNDHSVRDFKISAPWLGKVDVGNTGFRFVRIDFLDKNRSVPILALRAIFTYRDLEYKGSFVSSDTLLNKIWETGAYTVNLCMQNYLWDGIKRDRLVWIGDMHPETMTILSAFGANNIIKSSLNLAKSNTPLPNWMNGISSYSMWWLIIQHDYYMYTGDKRYLEENKDYILELLKQFAKFIGPDNQEDLNGMRFLDWPTSGDPKVIHAGLQALLIKTFQEGSYLCGVLESPQEEKLCQDAINRLKKYVPNPGNSKQAAALMVLAGMENPSRLDKDVLAVDPTQKLSTFYGYYVLQARAMAGDIEGSLNVIRKYWGGMLKMGATTFWEDFDLSWMKNASRIDELTKKGEHDIHGDYGNYCYVGYRLSLCHGWASGPTPWLSEHILGIKPVEPGFKVVKIKPNLGDLKWVKGTFPTPYGIISVSAKRLVNGKIETNYKVPNGIKVIN